MEERSKLREVFEKFSNDKEYCCHISALDYEKILPLKLKRYAELLSRIRNKALRKNELGSACNAIAKLIEYEIMSLGYYCRIIYVWRDHGDADNTFFVRKYILTCPSFKSAEVKNQTRKQFFEKYKINIRFENNHPNDEQLANDEFFIFPQKYFESTQG